MDGDAQTEAWQRRTLSSPFAKKVLNKDSSGPGSRDTFMVMVSSRSLEIGVNESSSKQ